MKMVINDDDFCLVGDVWSGNGEVDERTLSENRVRGLYIRLNDMNGGHKIDKNFHRQWYESQFLERAPYFVYNPWVPGEENFRFLESVMPDDAKTVIDDIEVRKNGYPPRTYAGEFEKFRILSSRRWKNIIYTGGGYIDIMSKWPVADYIWARYPSAFLPKDIIGVYPTWLEIINKLAKTEWNPGMKLKGNCRMWQIADHYVLPGCTHALDVNVFKGSVKELHEFFSGPESELPVKEDDDVNDLPKYHVNTKSGLNVRKSPEIKKGNVLYALPYYTYGRPTEVTIYEQSGHFKEWSRIDPVEQKWVFTLYLSPN
jgi:hypothetical protein